MRVEPFKLRSPLITSLSFALAVAASLERSKCTRPPLRVSGEAVVVSPSVNTPTVPTRPGASVLPAFDIVTAP